LRLVSWHEIVLGEQTIEEMPELVMAMDAKLQT
jgi:hypothetical protein